MKKMRCFHAGWWAALAAAVFIVPSVLLADDTELFTTRANPNVLLMIDTTGSMDTRDPAVPSGSIGDLDGDGTSDTRLDILYKVTYTLLNADLSIPLTTNNYSVTLRQNITPGPFSGDLRVACGGDFGNLPPGPVSAPGYTVRVGSGVTGTRTEPFTYTRKYQTTGPNRCYLTVPSGNTFTYNHNSTSESVFYSTVTSYTVPYPLDHTQADSGEFLSNLDNTDESLMKARLGVMRFKTNSTGTADGISILNQIQSNAPNAPRFAPTYQDVWSSIRGLTPGGGTPTAQAISAAQGFFNTAYNSGQICRKNFAVLLTDGEDTAGITGAGNTGGTLGSPNYYHWPNGTYSANWTSGATYDADGYSGNTGQVARNNQVVQAAKALKDSSRAVEMFTVGLGIGANQPAFRTLRHVLRRAAQQQGITETAAQYTDIGNGTVPEDNTVGTVNSVQKAFFTTDATELAEALHNIFQQITRGTFSYTAPTVLSVRAVDKNELYTASFEPALPPNTLWRGHLKAYNYISADNTTFRWDAAEVLKATSPANRNVYTMDNTTTPVSRRVFDTSIPPADLGLPSGDTAGRNAVVNYVRGVGHTSSSDNNYVLGDIFHSKPVLVGAPSRFYVDEGYSEYVTAKADRRRVLYAGANDGTMHAFLAGDLDNTTGKYTLHDTGEELFAYLPYNLLGNVSNYLPTTASSHDYYVDSSPRVADVWWDDDSDGNKQPSEWRTVLISGMRKGGEGYYALDVTSPPKSGGFTDANYPKVLWEFTDPSLAESWSEPVIAKVRQKSSAIAPVRDRFVAIFGGGRSDTGDVGRSLFVIDVKTGAVLKKFTGMVGEVVASPTMVLDLQGYIRYVFVADLSGNVYKFDFRSVGDDYGASPFSAWVGYRIFQPTSGGQPAYHRVEVATVDAVGSQRQIYFGTGDREAPISNASAGRFYMILDDDSKTTATQGNELADFTGSIASASGGSLGSSKGWYINLGSIASTTNDNVTHQGEKVLSDPVVFFNRVYFTTFTPNASDPCSGGGIARLYGLDWFSAGAGMMPVAALGETTSEPKVPTHVFSGKGLPSSPSLSVNPWGQSSLFIGFSDASYKEIVVASPTQSKKLRSWQEMN